MGFTFKKKIAHICNISIYDSYKLFKLNKNFYLKIVYFCFISNSKFFNFKRKKNRKHINLNRKTKLMRKRNSNQKADVSFPLEGSIIMIFHIQIHL